MQISWADFWDIGKGIIVPESATVIASVLLYGFLGLLLAIGLLLLGRRLRFFTRNQRYYNWAVKLYIPLVLLGTLYCSLQLGFVRGVYKVMSHQTQSITEGVYAQTVDRLFETQAEKDAYLTILRGTVMVYNQSSTAFADSLKQSIMKNEVGYGIVDETKNKVSAYLIDTYKDDLFSAIVAGAISQASKKVSPAELTWSESRALIDVLLEADAAQLELAIHQKLIELLDRLFYSQYASIRSSTLLLWFFTVVFIPLLEWAIYVQWLRGYLDRRRHAATVADRASI